MKKYISNKIKDLKLESSLHFKKYASVGHFEDIISDEDIKVNAKMIHELLELPQYQSILNRLRGANGVVNFVTNEDFEPLVEMLIKKAFPPSNNDVFNMGFESNLPANYFIDAAYFFGQSDQSQQAIQAARQSLNQLFMGTSAKMTREWLKENNVSPQALAEAYGMSAEDAELSSIADLIEQYEQAIESLKTGILSKEINGIAEQLRGHQKGVKTLSQEQIGKLQKELKIKEGFYLQRLRAIQTAPEYDIITIRDSFTKVPQRNPDGFLNWDPVRDIMDVRDQLIYMIQRKEEDEPGIVGIIEVLKEKLMEYSTSDPDLIKIRNQIIQFFGDSDTTAYTQIIRATKTYIRLQNAFSVRARKHGKLMILKDTENSVLCTPPSEASKANYHFQAKGVLDRFVGVNNSNFLRDLPGTKAARGKRVVVMISNAPIANLPKSGSMVIEMPSGAVDEKAAEIIVRNSLERYTIEARRAMELNLSSSIEEKYEGKIYDRTDLVNRSNDLLNVRTQLAQMESVLDTDVQTHITQLIIDMSTGEAIRSVNRVLANNATYVKDDKGLVTEVSLDSQKVRSDIAEIINEEGEGRGLAIREPRVEFQNYAYNKLSNWGARVRSVGNNAKELARLRAEIRNRLDQIAKIDVKLIDSKLGAKTKRDYLTSREGYLADIQNLRLQQTNVMAGLPHFVILYGVAGVGKSVWADALGSLLGYVVRNVNLSALRDKWLGNTEKYTDDLINKMLTARDSIFLMDEIDRMLRMGHGSSGTGSAGGGSHETTAQIVKRFLDVFEDQKEILIDHNVFIIMTTNNIEDVDTPLVDRTAGNTFEVETSADPQDFITFFNGFLETEYNKAPTKPWFSGPGDMNTEESWASTFKLFKDQLDYRKIAKACADKRLPFRFLESMLKTASQLHRDWLISMGAIGRGESVELDGLPMTTENMLQMIYSSATQRVQNADYDLGAYSVMNDRHKAIQDISKDGMDLQSTEYTNPITKEVGQRYVLGDDIMKIMNGQIEGEAEKAQPQFTVTEDGGVKQVALRPEEEIDKLRGEAFEDVSPEKTLVEKRPGEKEEKPKETEKKEEVKSFTDYLFNYLKREGIVSEDEKSIIAKGQIKKAQTPNVQTGDGREEEFKQGVYDWGWCLIAPYDDKTPSQYFRDMKKGK